MLERAIYAACKSADLAIAGRNVIVEEPGEVSLAADAGYRGKRGLTDTGSISRSAMLRWNIRRLLQANCGSRFFGWLERQRTDCAYSSSVLRLDKARTQRVSYIGALLTRRIPAVARPITSERSPHLCAGERGGARRSLHGARNRTLTAPWSNACETFFHRTAPLRPM
jgi:hypothetical protein